MNPYEPPRPDSIAPWQPTETFQPIVVRFANSVEQALQSVNRFRSLSSARNSVMRYAAVVPIIVMLGIYVLITVVQSGMRVPARFRKPPALPALVPLLAVILLTSIWGLLLRWRLRQTLSRSPIFGGEAMFTLAENGVQMTYPNCESKLTWNAFTQAAIFDDGALLVQAPGFYWLPYQAIDGDYGQERMVALVKSKIPKIIDRRKN